MDKSATATRIKVIPCAILWIVSYAFCFLVVKELHPAKPLGIVLSLLPVLTFALFIYSIVKNVATLDEVEIRIQMEAAVLAFTLSLLLLMTLGLLDLVIVLKKDDWGYRHLVPMVFTFYFFGLFIARRKYS